jgi:GNAT superfamily N-acetyltransferase
MLHELAGGTFARVGHLFAGVAHHLVIPAVIAGEARGRVWVDDPAEPTLAFLWDMADGLGYLVGRPGNAGRSEALSAFFLSTLAPEDRRYGYRRFYLHATPGVWDTTRETLLQSIVHSAQRLRFYAHTDPDRLVDWRSGLPPGFEMRRITPDLLQRSPLDNLDQVVYCVQAVWGSVEAYGDRAVGTCLLHGDQVAAWCSTDWIQAGACELYVETFKPYQRRGLGTLVASACVEACRSEGWAVHWHCWAENVGSVRLAERLGFAKRDEYLFHALDLAHAGE